MSRDVWKLAIPWVLVQLGVRKWLKERALRLPSAYVVNAAAIAGVTVTQWRAVESVQADIVYGMALETTRVSE